MTFSERQGIKPVKSIIQIDSMDDELRNGLWNVLHGHFWHRFERDKGVPEINLLAREGQNFWVLRDLWSEHFKLPVDEIPTFWVRLA